MRVSVPLKLLTALGLKVTVTVQLAPAASPVPQLLVSVNCDRLDTMLLIFMPAAAWLVTVRVWEALVVFICWLPNANNMADRPIPGAGTVTCAVTIFVRLPVLATTVMG